MRIVQVIDQLGLGGAERVCVNLSNILHRNGNTVKIIVLRNKGELFDFIDEGIEVVVLNKNEGNFKAYKKFVSAIKDDDIIHAHMRSTYRFVRKAFLFCGGSKPTILHDHHGKIVTNESVPLLYKTFFKPQFYIGCSKLLTTWAVNKVKINPKNVFLVNNFVLQYKSLPVNKEDKNGLVLVGTLKKEKNHKLAIDIAKALDKNLTIYCSHTSDKNTYFQELKTYIKTLKVEDKIHFEMGCNNVQTELKKYELALLTSISEGDPLALIEYIAQGMPFLSSDVGEAVKVIKEYYPFLIQNDFSVENWVNNYSKAIEIEPEKIEDLYNKYFSSDLYLSQYLKIYETFFKIF